MNSTLHIGIIREGKTPPDFRVPLTPKQCREILDQHPNVQISVQTSPHRKFKDEEYTSQGILVQEDLSSCDVLMGVKEVPVEALIPNKTYFFFSHTIKKQPYNAKLLRAVLDKKIRLIDYEVIKDAAGKRLIGFGRYAGIVGVFEGIRALGMKHGWFQLPAPITFHDRVEMESAGSNIQFPRPIKAVVTGWGRVGHGAEEMIRFFKFEKVTLKDYLEKSFDHSVYVHLDSEDYYVHKENGTFDKKDFYQNPSLYTSVLGDIIQQADIYFACHLWKAHNPVLITQDDLRSPQNQCRVIADISCDIAGPIASTLRATSITDPFFGYDPETHQECDWKSEEAIMVMSIDNLPCELPRDASEDFGNEFIKNVLPELLKPESIMLEKASETKDGQLTPDFEYLKDYAQS
jgi:alanine dehydrogenase